MAYRQHGLDQGSRQGSRYHLKFSDAQQKQENQIKAIRSYIAQKVDVIAFARS
jgi:ABC-type sugar transport system substrate-binding protein